MKWNSIYHGIFGIALWFLTQGQPVHAAAKANVTVDYQARREAYPQVFGSQIWWTDQDSLTYVAAWRDLGINTVRVGLMQEMIEPQNDDADPGHCRWENFYFDRAIPLGITSEKTITLSKLFQAIRDAGLNVIVVNFYLAAWNSKVDRGARSPFPPRDLAEHQEFLHTFLSWLVNQIHFPPNRILLEPMNEPDFPGLGFWENGSLTEIAGVAWVAHQAAAAVDARIRVIGPSETMSTTITESLMREFDAARYLDGLAFHYYGVNFEPVFDRVNTLRTFGLPLYLTEYGNLDDSNQELAATLWHSRILAEIWQRTPDLQPIQFTLTSYPTGLDEENIFNLALQLDWRYQWERRPAFLIYQHFWRMFQGTRRVNSQTSADLSLIAARKMPDASPAALSLWLTNQTGQDYTAVTFTVQGFPCKHGQILVYSNLDTATVIDSLRAFGTPLRFQYRLPAYCSVRMELTESMPALAKSGWNGRPPEALRLAQNYPNPFNPSTRIEFYLPAATKITLSIFDLKGNLIRILAAGIAPAAFSSCTWDGRDQQGQRVATGIYCYQLKTSTAQVTKKLTVMH